jgi:hypothetical protein
MVMSICKWCGKAFEPDAKSLRNPNYRADFCSRPCANRGRSKPMRERFAAFMEAADKSTGCWLWPGPRDRNGYGVITDENRKQLRAPRVSYELHHGPIPEGRMVLHSCDNPPCVNPAHLSLGGAAENAIDRYARGRGALGRGHGRAKLNEEAVQAIRTRYAAGETQVALAHEYGVAQPVISLLVRRETWKHVE